MSVTVAIPFFNNSETIRSAIQSVFAQVYNSWTLVLIDDGSTDDSLRIAKSIEDPRVRVISDGVNRGLVYRLNQAASLAEDELLARMDADDLMHPERLARQVEYFARHPEMDVVGVGTFYVLDRDGRAVGKRSVEPWLRRAGLEQGYLHPSITGKTAWFRANPYDPAYTRAEDLELWYRTQGQIVGHNLSEALYFYREAGCFSIRKYRESSQSERRILRRYGPAPRGRRWTLYRIAKSYCKQAAYTSLVRLGAEDLLIRRRSIPLTNGERSLASHIIDGVMQTHVPGLHPGVT